MFLKYVKAMKYLEIIPDFLSMYGGVFTSRSTSQIRQEMSNTKVNDLNRVFMPYSMNINDNLHVVMICGSKICIFKQPE